MANKKFKPKKNGRGGITKKRVASPKTTITPLKTKGYLGSKKGESIKDKTQKSPLVSVIVPENRGKEPILQKPLGSELIVKDKDSDICVIEGCEESKTTGDFCRLHYISRWRKLKKKERVLAEKRLNKYIEELTSRYPDEYLEVIKRDLSSDKNFAELLQELEIEDVDEVVSLEEEDDEFAKKFRPEEEEF